MIQVGEEETQQQLFFYQNQTFLIKICKDFGSGSAKKAFNCYLFFYF